MKKQAKSQGEVGSLVEQALACLPQPWSEDIILDVCNIIQNDPLLLSRYDELVKLREKGVVNRQIGHSTLQLTGLRNLGIRKDAQNSIIRTYTLLG